MRGVECVVLYIYIYVSRYLAHEQTQSAKNINEALCEQKINKNVDDGGEDAKKDEEEENSLKFSHRNQKNNNNIITTEIKTHRPECV